ncbi:Hypothetical predicted protein [Octopus vulgaris]|uniref:Uncharacterized protein n=1 Tax=Octopus vulgaris TaxID=6645 RepID=A0AA36BR32_OCTVU|nr:Hypothetical predicted protein [Octopus vulgaris]
MIKTSISENDLTRGGFNIIKKIASESSGRSGERLCQLGECLHHLGEYLNLLMTILANSAPFPPTAPSVRKSTSASAISGHQSHQVTSPY